MHRNHIRLSTKHSTVPSTAQHQAPSIRSSVLRRRSRQGRNSSPSRSLSLPLAPNRRSAHLHESPHSGSDQDQAPRPIPNSTLCYALHSSTSQLLPTVRVFQPLTSFLPTAASQLDRTLHLLGPTLLVFLTSYNSSWSCSRLRHTPSQTEYPAGTVPPLYPKLQH